MADHLDQRLVIVNVALQRRDVEIADQQRRAVKRVRPAGHPLQKVQLLAELGIGLAVGNVAAGRDVDIFQHQALSGTEQFDPDMARFAIGLPVIAGHFAQRDPADRGHPVIALLPVDRAVRVAQRFEGFVREVLFLGLDLLQAQHVGLLLFQEAHDLVDPQADRIDVPGGNRDHAAALGSQQRGGKACGGRSRPVRPHWLQLLIRSI